MKKALVFGLIGILIGSFVCGMEFADRVEDLTKENQQLQQEITKRQQEINQITRIILENIGRIKEIKRTEEGDESN